MSALAGTPGPFAEAAIAPLPRSTKLWYALGQAGEGIKNESFAYFLLFYYTQVLGLAGTLAGGAIAISMIVDAFTDPLMGVLTDRTRSRLGRRHPWIFLSAPPLAASLYLVFAPPVGLSQGALFAWMLCWTLVNRFALTMFHVPYLSLGAELTRDWHERTVLVSMRHSFGQVAGMFPAFVGLLWLFRQTAEHGDGRVYAAAYPTYAALAAGSVLLVIFATAWMTRDRIPTLPQADARAREHGVLRALWRDLSEVLQQRSFRAVFLGTAISSVGSGVTISLGIHAAKFFWDVDSRVMFWWRVVLAGALVLGLAYWTQRATRAEKGALFSEGLLWYVAIHSLVYVLATLGFWPERSSAAYVPLYLIATGLLAGFAVASVFAMGQSMMGDCADQDELATGRRREGMFFGASSLALKFAFGGGALVAGLIVDAVGLTGLRSIADVTPAIRWHLGVAMALSVAVLFSLSWLAFRRYDLTRARLADIHAQLSQRGSAP